MASSSTAVLPGFEDWLCGVLEAAGADGEVYGGYIGGSLATMEGSSREEMEETLQEILSVCVEDEGACSELCTKVMDEWLQREAERTAKELEEEEKSKTVTDNFPVSSKSVGRGRREREEERKSGAVVGGLTAVEKRKLVSQYGDLSNDEDDDLDGLADDPGGGGASGSYQAPTMESVFQNVNAQLVTLTEREKKEKDKSAHEAKVERDRKNRDAQKQKQLDRKEKEKKRTQKHEKRR